MCACVVAGAAGAADGLREAVLLAGQQCELPGALQRPATGQQPDQVRPVHSAEPKTVPK